MAVHDFLRMQNCLIEGRPWAQKRKSTGHSQEVADAHEDGIMAVIVPPPTERVGAGIQHMKEGLHRIRAGVVIHFHRCRLALCGSVSVRELSANLSICSVRVEIAADQSCGDLLSSWSGRFCLERLVL